MLGVANVTDLPVFKTPKIMSKSCFRRKEMPMTKRRKVITFHIVFSNNHPTELICQFVDHHLKPSYVKDAADCPNKLANAILVTLDVTSLYTNIPHSEGIEACRFFLQNVTTNTFPQKPSGAVSA